MITNPNIQRYTIEIYFYAKDVMPTSKILFNYCGSMASRSIVLSVGVATVIGWTIATEFLLS